MGRFMQPARPPLPQLTCRSVARAYVSVHVIRLDSSKQRAKDVLGKDGKCMRRPRRGVLALRLNGGRDCPLPVCLSAHEFVWFAVPGEALVVGGVASQAAVEDADEPVGEGAEGLVVGRSAGALSVIEGAGAR